MRSKPCSSAAARPAFTEENCWPFSQFGLSTYSSSANNAALFSASPEERLALIRAYPDLGRVFDRGSGATALSVVDQAMAGLDRLDSDEHYSLDGLTSAYRERFGFPLIIAVRDNTKASILEQGNRRLLNSPVADVMDESFPVIDVDTSLNEIKAKLQKYPAVLIEDFKRITGIITRSDVLELQK